MARKNQQRALRQAAERAARQQLAENIATTVVTTFESTPHSSECGEEHNSAAATDSRDDTSKTYTAV